jgi:hypothetical protein
MIMGLIAAFQWQLLRPRAWMAWLPPRLLLLVRFRGGLNPWLSLEGGLCDELRELRPMRTRRLVSSAARTVSC